MKMRGEKNWKGKQNQWAVDHIKQPNTSVIRIPEGEETDKGVESLSGK